MAETYKFADFELDRAKRALLKNGGVVSLNPKAFDLLVVLVENRGEIVSKDELINSVWEGQFVEENNITVQISALRKILGDKVKFAKFLQTIPGKGYKFIADVETVDEEIIFEKRFTSSLVLEEEETNDESARTIPRISKKINTHKSPKISPRFFFAVAVIFVLTGVVAFQFWGNQNKSNKYRLIKTDKLTTSGKITNLALTPNGEYVVYSQQEGIGESLWLRHLETSGQQQIISPQSAKFVGLTISPDGNFIYFSRFGNEAETYLEKVSILGGVPEKISEIDSAVTVSCSPDGKRLAFTESHTAEGKTSLSVADIDGLNKTTLISAKNDERILATYDSNPIAWSPTGEFIAVAVEEKASDGSSSMSIVLINPFDKSEKKITEKRWKYAMELTWIDSDNLAFYAKDEDAKNADIWIVSKKSGDYYQLTNDSDFYGRLSGQNGKLVAIRGSEVSRIKFAEFGDDLKNFKLIEVFNDSGHIGDVAWTNDGEILYTSKTSGKNEIWQIDETGKKPQQLTTKSNISGGISVSSKDGSIVFEADKDNFSTLWLVDDKGRNLRQITFANEDARASFTGDGGSIVFQRGTTFGKQTLWELTLENEKLRQITKNHTSHPQVSNDGKMTAYYFMDEATDKRWRIGIVDNLSGEVLNKISFPVVVNHRRMKWHPNNQSLTQVFYEGEDAKLLLLPISGGEHKIIDGFGKGEIISLDWSKDGKSLLFSQVNEIRDVVMFGINKE